MRCFISISLPEETKKGILAIQAKLKTSAADVTWSRPGGMHLTLKFLGEIEENSLPRIETAMNRTVNAFDPFSLDVSGIGVFPDAKRPRVVWIGINEDGDNLVRLQRDIEKELEIAGFPKEDRRFTAHITLGRIRSNKNISKLSGLIEEDKDIELGKFEALNIHLMKSELRPEGSVYTQLYSVSLKGDKHG